MKITTDNVSVDNSINTYKCPVINDGTVLLKPSQIKKYLGSYIKHKITGFGILLPKGFILDIVSTDIIDGNDWLVVSYNNTYYYTPKEYVDTSKIININTNIDSFSTKNNTQKSVLGINQKIAMAGSTNSKTLYSANNCKIAEALTNIELREYPDPNSGVNRILSKGEKCIVQSLWKNDEYKSNWFGTATFTPNGGLYGKYINNSNVKLIQPSLQYSVIINSTNCTYMNGQYFSSLKRGDLTWPKYQDWEKGYHVNVQQGSNGGLITYRYPANSASPLADSADMINTEYLGELRVNTIATVYAFHRKSNYKSTADKNLSLDNISLAALKSAANSVKNIKDILEQGFDDYAKGPASKGITNAELLSTGEVMVVTNYATISGKKYYIGFRKTSATNGAINYIALLDGGSNYINYTKYPPAGVDINNNIPTTETTKYENVKDVDIDTSTHTKDISNLDDLTHVKYTNKLQNENAYGVHLGIGDTSKFQVPGILTNAPNVPPDYAGWPILSSAENYNLSSEMPFDTKHLTHINRFHLPTGNSGLSTKSFIFVTRPDLNLYTELDEVNVDTWAMNPDLKRLACFKYIARMRGTPESPGIGTKIMSSLEYFGTNEINTPWLSVLTNQCNGYAVVDRELDVTEMAETFHGNKVIYAEPTFKHKIGGTVQIPFIERRDLTLYFTLRMWVEYIQAVSMGFCSPRMCHRKDHELDYAVSLFYITTDETMENILYWEKLTGLIPLTVPDSFFEWTEGNGAREMKYSINFAYSFRTVMDELHLAEINNVYQKYRTSNATGMPIVPQNYYDYNYDGKNNELLARVAAFYEDIADNDSEISRLVNNKSALDKYYYGGIVSPDGSIANVHTVKGSDDGQSTGQSNAKFLPNYNIHTRMHGIPYVKGPFIEHDPDAQKYKLRWV